MRWWASEILQNLSVKHSSDEFALLLLIVFVAWWFHNHMLFIISKSDKLHRLIHCHGNGKYGNGPADWNPNILVLKWNSSIFGKIIDPNDSLVQNILTNEDLYFYCIYASLVERSLRKSHDLKLLNRLANANNINHVLSWEQSYLFIC